MRYPERSAGLYICEEGIGCLHPCIYNTLVGAMPPSQHNWCESHLFIPRALYHGISTNQTSFWC